MNHKITLRFFHITYIEVMMSPSFSLSRVLSLVFSLSVSLSIYIFIYKESSSNGIPSVITNLGNMNEVKMVFNKFNANEDGKISSVVTTFGAMNQVKMVFNKFDANGDGKISAAELREILGALGSDKSEIDKDGDGFIDLNEFTDFHRTCPAPDGSGDDDDKQLCDAFDLYDRNRNGKISASELHVVLKSLGEKCSLKACSRMISSADVDGDRGVNFEEFKKGMKV